MIQLKRLNEASGVVFNFPLNRRGRKSDAHVFSFDYDAERNLRVEKDGRWNDLTTGGGKVLLPLKILREIYDCHVAPVA